MYRTNQSGPGTSRTESTDGTDDPVVGVVAGVVSAGVLLVAFGALALGVEAWWLAFPLGYGGVLPLSVGLARWRAAGRASAVPTVGGASAPSTDDEEAGLATLRRRYAAGEIDEEEFERRVETLLWDAEAGRTDARRVGASTDDT